MICYAIDGMIESITEQKPKGDSNSAQQAPNVPYKTTVDGNEQAQPCRLYLPSYIVSNSVYEASPSSGRIRASSALIKGTC